MCKVNTIISQSETNAPKVQPLKRQRLSAAGKVCEENLCKIQFWLQWGNLPSITFRGNIEAKRESDNICHFVCQTNNCKKHNVILFP